MKRKRQSIKDIAKALGVSATTISFVLNGKGKEKKISDEMIEKVLTYTQEINYKPNRVAQSLRTGETKVLVFMVEDISNQFFARIARSMEDIAYAKGYRVLFCSTENEDKRARDLIDVFFERQADGFILIPTPGIMEEVAELASSDTPVILFDRYFPKLETHYVVIDNYEASYRAARHLVENDYRNIGFVTTDVQQTQMLDRLRGYEDAMKENDLPSHVLKIPFAQADTSAGRDAIRQLFKDRPALDAVYFATNVLTISGLAVIKEVFDTMQDIGIVTFDDNEFFRINTPSITAVAQPMEDLAKELMRVMLHLLDSKRKGKKVKRIQSVLRAELIPRGSSTSSARSPAAARQGTPRP